MRLSAASDSFPGACRIAVRPLSLDLRMCRRPFPARTRPARIAAAVALAALVGRCAPAAPSIDSSPPVAPAAAPLVEPTSRPELLDDGDAASLLAAVEHSLAWLATVPPDTTFDYGVRRVAAADLADALGTLRGFLASGPDPVALREWIDARFDVVESVGEPRGEVLVTGYYEPVIPGSPVRTESARVPVHALPADLVAARLRDLRETLPDERIAGRVDGGRLVPYFTRQQIQEEGALDGRGLEIAWVEDRVDLFFVEVQGSGAIRYPDGTELRIGYAGSNGRPYRSIGRLLIEEGRVPAERMSMQAIRAYLASNPHDVSRILDHNESYVFFRVLNSPPLGNLGVPVTGGRSIATDYRLFPPGALAFLETTRPAVDADGRVTEGAPLRRFVFNQDTGGAIRGAGRVDFFWGRGEEAERLAGPMQQRGRLFFLVPRAGL
jgi:membrane-bound lytic murein transglycosylase A